MCFLNDVISVICTALGEKSLCKTCKMYPRHVEEFEDVREITLSVSCPEVARILMVKRNRSVFLLMKQGEEEYDDFDPFLYSKLVDARKVMIDILQDRDKSWICVWGWYWQLHMTCRCGSRERISSQLMMYLKNTRQRRQYSL